MNEIGDILRAWRKRNGYTLQQAADLIGKHVNTYARLERGQTRMNSDYAKLLAPLLGDMAPLVCGYGIQTKTENKFNDSAEVSVLKAQLEEKDKRIKELENEVLHLSLENKLLSELKTIYEKRVPEEN